jgi:hypothetical protein
MHFFTSSQCFWMALTLQNLKLGGNLEFSWYSCNILRYCSNRCTIWFFIPANCPAQANKKFPVQLYVKIQILFEPPFWICKWANHLSFLAMWNCWPLFKFYFQKHSFNVKKKYVDCIIFFPTDYYSTSWVLKHFPSGVVWLWNLLYTRPWLF